MSGRGGGESTKRGGGGEPNLLAPPGGVPIGQARGAASGRVRNRSAAELQITAGQLLLEAREAQEQLDPSSSSRTAGPQLSGALAADAEEIADFRAHRRRALESLVRSAPWRASNWSKYARWEIAQGDMRRARSVFERALEADPRCVPHWVAYAEAESAAGQPAHARNVWSRAVTALPRCDKLWLRWALMEQQLGPEHGDARGVFEAWVLWHPPASAWDAWVRFELSSGDETTARAVFERYIAELPSVQTWVRYARFEEDGSRPHLARAVFERAAVSLGDAIRADDAYFVAFAGLEERCGEDERARAIYKHAVAVVPRRSAAELYRRYIAFEKLRGDRDGIEAVVVGKRRVQYEEEVTRDPRAYDAWFDYARLEESAGEFERARRVYARAQAAAPEPRAGKDAWRRYIYLWINHALMEELDAEEPARARDVYRRAVDAVPHKRFSFSKLWLLYADFELRQLDLTSARRVLGAAIGLAPKERIFERYVALESELGCVDRCRSVYAKWLEFDPRSPRAWCGLAEMERALGEQERARAVFELAVSPQVDLETPEIAWKRYIDAEIAWGEQTRARDLFERLAAATNHHTRVYAAWAGFEVAAGSTERARDVYRAADRALAGDADRTEDRVAALAAWAALERDHGDGASRAAIAARKPRRVKRAVVDRITGKRSEVEEWMFPEPERDAASKPGGLKILEMAMKWKKARSSGPGGGDGTTANAESKSGPGGVQGP